MHIGINGYASCSLYNSLSSSCGSLARHALRQESASHRSEDGSIHRALDVGSQKLVHTLIEEYGGIRLEPLRRTKNARSVAPKVAIVALEHKLLCDGVLALFLVHGKIVYWHIVDIHSHEIVEMLIGSCGREVQTAYRCAEIYCCIKHVTTITALLICVWIVGCVIISHSAIREGILVSMLEVDNSVEIACGRRSINELKSSTSLLTLVGFGVEKMIAEIALVVDKETSYREASLVGNTTAKVDVGGD